MSRCAAGPAVSGERYASSPPPLGDGDGGAREQPALNAGSELLARVGLAAAELALRHESNESYIMDEARWEEGLKAALRFEVQKLSLRC